MYITVHSFIDPKHDGFVFPVLTSDEDIQTKKISRVALTKRLSRIDTTLLKENEASVGYSEQKESESEDNEAVKVLKLAAPHIILILLLMGYTIICALVIQYLEYDYDQQVGVERGKALKRVYKDIAITTWKMQKTPNDYSNFTEWSISIHKILTKVSAFHERSKSFDIEMYERSRWTFPTCVLYVITVLTTCGYNYIEPVTVSGQIWGVIFALLGIPLMFITAADIGKFLSEILMWFWRKSAPCRDKVKTTFCGKKKSGLDSNEESQNIYPDQSCPCDVPTEEQTLLELLEEEESVDDLGIWFPVGAYVFLLCCYALMGAFLFNNWEENFIFRHAFHFAFTLIITCGLGGIVVENFLYLILIVTYVIVGLAIVTMCVDLASTQLKSYFTRIHYFGRARDMREDLRDLLLALGAIRRPKGHKLTIAELRFILAQQQLALRPFAPRHIHLWRFVDEPNSNYSTMRHNSFQSDLICNAWGLKPRMADSHHSAYSTIASAGGYLPDAVFSRSNNNTRLNCDLDNAMSHYFADR